MTWTKATLGQLAKDYDGAIQTGPFGAQLHSSDYQTVGTPTVMPQNIVDDRIDTYDIARVDEAMVRKLSRHVLEEGDILYPRRGNLNKRALITDQEAGWLCGTGCIKISLSKSPIDSRFLFYYLKHPSVVERIENQAVGATMLNLSATILKSIEVEYPEQNLQDRISSTLSNYDDLIDNNNRRIALLEEAVHRLYREWFVHLRFPGYERVAVVDGVPEGWRLESLKDLGFLGRGKSKHRPRNDPSLYGGEYPFIQTGNVKKASSSLYITEHEQTYSDQGLSQSKLWEKDTLLITIAANIAETAILSYPSCFPDSIIGFIPHPKVVTTEYIKFSIDHLKTSMQSISQGSTQDNLSQRKLSSFAFLVPPTEIMENFQQSSNHTFSQIKNLLFQNKHLREARDRLLPRLMNGSIPV